MGFTLTDGVSTHAGRLEFTMDVRKSEGPRMTVNRGLQLPAGEGGGVGLAPDEGGEASVETKTLSAFSFCSLQVLRLRSRSRT